eukprot:SAG22_NODE_6741_length_817_cov_1.218663_1_plen_39_part_10
MSRAVAADAVEVLLRADWGVSWLEAEVTNVSGDVESSSS